MVFRLFVERKPAFALEADALIGELGLASAVRARVFNRYDVENIPETLFGQAKTTVFSEPRTDVRYDVLPDPEGAFVLAVEALPGQYDQRADAAEQCLQLISQGDRPTVRTARIYYIYGDLSAADRETVRRHLINPVESREASLGTFATLRAEYPAPEPVAVLHDFCDAEPAAVCKRYGLAMDAADVAFTQAHFRSEGRAPTLTELRVLDTYWSDHCRHTTFLTELTDVQFEDPAAEKAYRRYLEIRKALGVTKPVCLMNLATIGAKYLKKAGKLEKLDDSKEINACTVKVTIEVDGTPEPWLLLFKNETHNHPTEIEPFGGAATCLGGAIRDPLSGRAYVYQAMRVTGAADPRPGRSPELRGKLPQRRIVTSAAAGYSSYGNQIGLATGLVDEIYHPGYQAKRMEIGAVIGAAPAANVRREEPEAGDVVLLIGGKTGRDGCGGATGSSKAHQESSLSLCGSEVQKGNAPEERKLQRLFRNPEAAKRIKRCNDFGAGGVSVAIGELADGLTIHLDSVPRKYFGLDGTELAISESQERMAVVVEAADAAHMIALAASENLLAVEVAEVTEAPRLVMEWQGSRIVDLPRVFIDSNGAPKTTRARVQTPKTAPALPRSFTALCEDPNVCLKRGLSERFDSTVGANTVLMPFGGKYQLTPAQAMAAKLPVPHGSTDACSVMAYGFHPNLSEASPYAGAYMAVVESVAKLVAAGAPLTDAYLSFQEYFPKPGTDPARWGLPLSALLGALDAQLDLGIAAIGGKDSMSGSFEQLDVPPTLVSFAAALADSRTVISPEFKKADSRVALLQPEYGPNGLPVPASLLSLFARVHKLIVSGQAISAWTPAYGGVAEGVMKMCLGNGIGFRFSEQADPFARLNGAFILELADGAEDGETLGYTTADGTLTFGAERYTAQTLRKMLESPLEGVYPTAPRAAENAPVAPLTFRTSAHVRCMSHAAAPKALIPVFPGTNCEYESARAVELAGGRAEVMVLNTLSASGIQQSTQQFRKLLSESQILFLPGGFSGGDEPDGSGRFITAFLRNEGIREEIETLLHRRDGLILGICNGFQALIKLGLVPYGKILPPSEDAPTLTFNTIGRHQSRLVRTRVCSNLSPWMRHAEPGEIFTIPISHGEGRFVCSDEQFRELAANGQILSQYADDEGMPTMDPFWNPNGSMMAVEGITSPDGRVLGKMGHSERIGSGLYKNVPGKQDMGLFRSAMEYFA